MATSTDSLFEFMKIVGDKGHWNRHTVNSRKTACTTLFEILDPEQRTIEYVKDNIDVIKARFANLHKEMNGATIDAYASRVPLVINEYLKWSTDRGAWEKANSQRQAARASGDTSKKQRATKPKVAASEADEADEEDDAPIDVPYRVIDFPLRPGFDVKIKLPRDVTMAEVRKLAYVMALHATDFEPTMSQAELFPKLGNSNNGNRPSA